MSQTIDWTTRPGWGFGQNATPIEYESLLRHFYSLYNPSSNPPVSYGAGTPGYYVVTLSHMDWVSTNGSNLRGSAPGAFVGPNGMDPYEGILMTIAWPKAKRRVDFTLRVTANGANNMSISIARKWFDTDTLTEVTAPNGAGPAIGSMGHYYNSISVASEDWPGQSIIWYNIPGHGTCYGFTRLNDYYSGGYHYSFLEGTVIDIEQWSNYMNQQNPDLDFSEWDVVTESPEVGPPSSTSDIGYGDDPRSSDSPHVPDVPGATAAALGFINIYNPSAGGLTSLGSEIFPDFDFTFVVDPTGNTVIDAILNAASAFVDCINQVPKMFQVIMNSRLIDYVQDCHIVPVKPSTGAADHIKLGFRSLDTMAAVVSNEYVKVSLGTVSINEIRKMFMDFLPYTRAKLYLPFVGYVPVEPEYFQDGVLGVEYIFNVYDGSFMAFVTSSPSTKVSYMSSAIVGSYTGTAIIHLPLTGLNYSSMVAGLIGGAGAMVSTIAGGNPAAAATAALNTATASPQVMTSNAYTASASFLGYRYPFLVMERSTSHFPQNYSHDVGLPSKITVNLSAAQGFVKISDVDLTGVDAMDSEKEEIRKLLASGIYC